MMISFDLPRKQGLAINLWRNRAHLANTEDKRLIGLGYTAFQRAVEKAILRGDKKAAKAERLIAQKEEAV